MDEYCNIRNCPSYGQSTSVVTNNSAAYTNTSQLK